MTTTLREPMQDETVRSTPSPWSAPRADGALASALRLAQAQRRQGEPAAPVPPADDAREAAEGFGVPEPPQAAPIESLREDIEALAREAQARDEAREALAIALEWPQQAGSSDRRARTWKGWLGLVAALVLAGAAAALAAWLAPNEAAPVAGDGLRIERTLALPPPARAALPP